MSKALYRKYRSKSLEEVIGQKHITDILSRAISEGHISHAYLLTGPRGVGKTSVARILAHQINGLDYNEDNFNLDIIEIDAASNNGVEDVRDLREKVQIAPVNASKKVYIIDEVHMLSKAAFNALLKTLEEPPEHVVFILATTNVEKLPATIISRTQRFSFRPITIDDAVNHLDYIAKMEKIKVDNDALKLIAERSDGSFRDSISLLDQLSNLVDNKTTITAKLIEESLGLAPKELIDQLLYAVDSKDLATIVSLLDNAFSSGVSCTVLVMQLTATIREQLTTKPQLLSLLDSLIDVTKSSQPQLKLLSVLGQAAIPKQTPKTAALLAPVYEVTATIAELEKQAELDKPIDIDKTDMEPSAVQNESSSDSNSRVADATFPSDSTEPKSGRVSGPLSRDEAKLDRKVNVTPKGDIEKHDIKPFNWARLIDYTRQNHIALHSVLSKCVHELDGNVLTLYTINKFYKNKLDDPKYSSLLSECLQETGVFGLDIHTIPTTIPPSDSQAAAVAAIMGGGVEVSLESA